MSFENFSFLPEMNAVLKTQGFETPTPIQAQAIPEVLSGKDIMGLAQTGAGGQAHTGCDFPCIHDAFLDLKVGFQLSGVAALRIVVEVPILVVVQVVDTKGRHQLRVDLPARAHIHRGVGAHAHVGITVHV